MSTPDKRAVELIPCHICDPEQIRQHCPCCMGSGKEPRYTPALSAPVAQPDVELVTTLRRTINYRLNDVLCEMKEGYDDSIVGFNAASDIVFECFAEISTRLLATPERDNCQICRGTQGGVRGNENIVHGILMCDYCHVSTEPLIKALTPERGTDAGLEAIIEQVEGPLFKTYAATLARALSDAGWSQQTACKPVDQPVLAAFCTNWLKRHIAKGGAFPSGKTFAEDLVAAGMIAGPVVTLTAIAQWLFDNFPHDPNGRPTDSYWMRKAAQFEALIEGRAP